MSGVAPAGGAPPGGGAKSPAAPGAGKAGKSPRKAPASGPAAGAGAKGKGVKSPGPNTKAPAGPGTAPKTKAPAGGSKSPAAPGAGGTAKSPKKKAATPTGATKSPAPPASGKSPKTKKTPTPTEGGPKSPTAPAAGKAPKRKSPAGAKSPGPSAAPSAPGGGKSPKRKTPTPTDGAGAAGAGGGSKSPAPSSTGNRSPAPSTSGAPTSATGTTGQPSSTAPQSTAPSAATSKAPTANPSTAGSPSAVPPPSTNAPAPPSSSATALGGASSGQATVAPSTAAPSAPAASSAEGASAAGTGGGLAPNASMNRSEVEPDFSPIPHTQSMVMAAGGPAAAGAGASPQRIQRRSAAPKKPTGPLTVDPRSGLPLIDIPRDKQHAFSHLGSDMVLHTWLECDRISSQGRPLRRVCFVTDQTLFVCDERGGILRCVPVSKISHVNVATDNSNSLALTIPSEYDVILRLDRRQLRDDLVVVLRAVFRRMTDSELNVRQVKEIRANQYRMDKPPGFHLQRIPQRTRAHLQKTLETIEMQEQERLEATEAIQAQLELEHKSELEAKLAESKAVRAKLDEATSRLNQQQQELERLRVAHSKCKKRVEEIEAQMGPTGDLPSDKDDKIRELNEVVEALHASVAKANEERMRIEERKRQGDFEQRDFDEIDVEVPRFRGRSLHQQGLVEVLQRQLLEKERELNSLRSRHMDVQRLKLELKAKQDQLQELETVVELAPQNPNDPTVLYSKLPGTSVSEMLDTTYQNYSPPRGGGVAAPGLTGVVIDPSIKIDQTGVTVSREGGVDEDGEQVHRGTLPQGKVTLGAGLPEYRLPADINDFRADPRTNLEFIEIPTQLKEAFKDLDGSIIHFFAMGTKLNKRGRAQKRVIVASDQSIYQCNTNGHINRCIWITSVREVFVDATGSVALLIDGKNEYDVAFHFDNVDTGDALATTLAKINSFVKRKPQMKITRIDRIITSDLKLEKPPTYEFKLHAIRRRGTLFKALQEMSKATAEERQKLHEAADQYTLEIVERLKNEMRGEINMRREREFAVLRQQLSLLHSSLQEKQMEVRNLRRRISDHKCVAEHVKVTASAAEMHDSPGMYWIPTDPVVMECQHEILCIQFHDNIVVTSHANGFLNVWDINSAELYRTLRNGHTARVEAFHYDGTDLISGGYDSSLRRWSIMESACLKTVHGAHKGHITCVKFDALHLVTSGTDTLLHVWDTRTLKKEKTLAGHKSPVTAFAFNRNVLASAEWGWIFLWDIDKGLVVKALRDDNGGIQTLDMFGMTLVTGGTGGVLSVWNLHTGEGEQLEGHTDDVHHVQLQQHFAISSSSDCTIRMWDVKDMSSLGVFHNSYPHECKKFHFKANRFAVGEGRTVKVWTR